jgi:hypothetical protein
MKAGFVLTKLDDEVNGLSDWRAPAGGIGVSQWLPPEDYGQNLSGDLVGRRWTNLVSGSVELKGYINGNPVSGELCTLPLELRPVAIRYITSLARSSGPNEQFSYIDCLEVHPNGKIMWTNSTIPSGGGNTRWGWCLDGAHFALD